MGIIFYDSELRFLRDTFRKAQVHTVVVAPGDPISSVMPAELEAITQTVYSGDMPLHKIIGKVEESTLYRARDVFGMTHLYFSLPESPKSEYFFVGPFFRTSVSPRDMLETAERLGISPKHQHYIEEYCNSIPVLPENNQLFIMLETFCELIWQSPSFAVLDSELEWLSPASPINEPSRSDGFDETLINMAALEKRYSYENNLMRSVALGQLHKEIAFPASFAERLIERRVSDPLRNIKNYIIIMNTLLRKAAEQGGVHPMYIDKMSSAFAVKIEQLSAVTDGAALMNEMYRAYCRLVRKHSLSDLSPVVQKAIILIESDLSANLTLSTLAAAQGISPGYLSTVFKKETGQTVSEYIRDKRMSHAVHLLTTTHLQIQTVALHCGIMDVQYFSKQFKKHTGKTPKEYRESAKQT